MKMNKLTNFIITNISLVGKCNLWIDIIAEDLLNYHIRRKKTNLKTEFPSQWVQTSTDLGKMTENLHGHITVQWVLLV